MNIEFISPISGDSLLKYENRYTNNSGDEEYRIINGVPRFVSSNNYASAFGLQWNEYAITQLDSYTETNITEDRLRKALPIPRFSVAVPGRPENRSAIPARPPASAISNNDLEFPLRSEAIAPFPKRG